MRLTSSVVCPSTLLHWWFPFWCPCTVRSSSMSWSSHLHASLNYCQRFVLSRNSFLVTARFSLAFFIVGLRKRWEIVLHTPVQGQLVVVSWAIHLRMIEPVVERVTSLPWLCSIFLSSGVEVFLPVRTLGSSITFNFHLLPQSFPTKGTSFIMTPAFISITWVIFQSCI